ncbi:MAG TPA: hypothetical protein VN026_10660, partial [Bacteroidia bacterium]|nr:hypothetical protein [Bacteroidia bacterium]
IRIVYRDRYFHDKVLPLPCDTLIKIIEHDCDTVILVDSAEIGVLKSRLFIDSLIIVNQFKVIRNDSLTVAGLNKQIRKYKRRLWFWKAAIVGLAGYEVLRK